MHFQGAGRLQELEKWVWLTMLTICICECLDQAQGTVWVQNWQSIMEKIKRGPGLIPPSTGTYLFDIPPFSFPRLVFREGSDPSEPNNFYPASQLKRWLHCKRIGITWFGFDESEVADTWTATSSSFSW